ncbi:MULTISPECIES: division/cell wall cluster transcriptional repressor MraZ [Lactobacillales]|uniref:Transcriptional regulator MraZ n=1 Tax=Aerococcus urinaeequi TaxID=51665 RepID=A0ABR5ZW24_9LACT|nr:MULTISPECIES: division/cell wall cluster transcriptional repressor MraZ [Lactobacillales]KAF3302546.1 division/cell wall cluster transcriptional repressor MraZ [Carnobacterium sp. PL17RED31]KAF3305299.1 division/cell wall cluster transcriptional repressor MraZ [Carnobacterium sp. PL17GRE32]MBA5745919.1 division/cell wall cluster transcriptional repressor MraZ [Aerococcus urinaeequi]MBA5828704.1 division/cell wall cluster transcriptional repressor MraZ [Aerococcus urinaeequi]MBA5859607.1 div
MLMGEFQHNIDAKGRIIIPAKLREDLGAKFVITRGLDGCVFGYPLENWEKIQEKLKQLPLAKKEARAFTRFFYSAAAEAEIDKQGRINIPSTLVDYASLEKECLVLGVSDRIEIWSKTKWESVSSEIEESFEEIAEDMLDFGL